MVFNYLSSEKQWVWIGLKRTTGNNFDWDNGALVQHTAWPSSEPKSNKDCVLFRENQWATSHCTLERHFACERPPQTEPETQCADRNVTSCHVGFSSLCGGCYKVEFDNSSVSWDTAKARCEGLVSHLTDLETQAEAVAVTAWFASKCLLGSGHLIFIERGTVEIAETIFTSDIL